MGGAPLNGIIPISGAKNAALPLMAAALLTEHPLILENLPDLADTALMGQILENHGVRLEVVAEAGARTLKLSAAQIDNLTAPYDLVRKMRASFWVLGPLLARFGEATVSLPGGC